MCNTLLKLSFLNLLLTAVLKRFIWLKNFSNEAFEKGVQVISPLVTVQAIKDGHPFLEPEFCPKNLPS